METRELHENWKMRCTEALDWQEAVVPGTVYTDLLRNGNMEILIGRIMKTAFAL